MEQSPEVRDGLLSFYERYSSQNADAFAAGIADVPGTSVIGTAPDEGRSNRADWIAGYTAMIQPGAPMAGMRMEGHDPRGWAEGSLGFAVDEPTFVLPDETRLPARLTAVLREEGGTWKIVHVHFSVGVSDDQAIAEAA